MAVKKACRGMTHHPPSPAPSLYPSHHVWLLPFLPSSVFSSLSSFFLFLSFTPSLPNTLSNSLSLPPPFLPLTLFSLILSPFPPPSFVSLPSPSLSPPNLREISWRHQQLTVTWLMWYLICSGESRFLSVGCWVAPDTRVTLCWVIKGGGRRREGGYREWHCESPALCIHLCQSRAEVPWNVRSPDPPKRMREHTFSSTWMPICDTLTLFYILNSYFLFLFSFFTL